MCSHTTAPQWVFSRVYNISFKIKMSKMESRPPKTLAKPYKYPPQDQKEEIKKK
jgi:hypothetical protein